MKNFNILHLSDLHYSDKTKKDIEIIKKALLEDIKNFISANPQLKPNIVIFSGDLAFSGKHDDFNNAYSAVLEPLLLELQVDKDDLFFCPGNHDIDRDKIKSYVESGLRESLKSRNDVNRLIDNYSEEDGTVFSRLEGYYSFKKKLESTKITEDHPIFSTYKLSYDNKTIGIACLNSAWRSYGGDENDLGKLIVGERALLKAISNISDCDLRIGVMHHPFSFIAPFEQIELERQVYESFNLWLHGHQHEPNFEEVKNLREKNSIVISGGSLYNSREYHNGYSLISLSLTDNSGILFLREYFDRTKKFAAAVAYAENGEIPLKIKQEIKSLSKNTTIRSQIRHASSLTDTSFAGSTLGELSIFPKKIGDIFVEPPLATESEESANSRDMIRNSKKKITKSRADTLRTLDQLMVSNKNILLVGKKESGKTTVLSRLYDMILNVNQEGFTKIPIMINYNNLPQGKDHTLRAIQSIFLNSSINIDIKQELEAGSLTILIDDFDFENKKLVNEFIKFSSEYADNRFVISTNEQAIDEIGVAELPDIGITYERIHIHSLRIKHIKELTTKWFKNDDVSDSYLGEIANQVHQSISAINLPSNPLIASLLLLVIEQQSDYAPINRATLIEKFIEILLEKRNPANAKTASFDFRNKEDILSHIAFTMDDRQEYQLLVSDFYKEIDNYFVTRGLTPPTQLETFVYENFIERGVLSEDNGKFFFRFGCFTEYFIAKYISESSDFLAHILAKDETLISYYNELDYLTGLQRKNKDLIVFVGERAKEITNAYFSEMGLDISLSSLDTLQFHSPTVESTESEDSPKHKEQAIDIIRRQRLTDVQKDNILDAIPTTSSEEKRKTIRKTPETLEAKAFGGISLLATMIKNCELIADKNFKKEYTNLSLDLYLKMLYAFIKKVDNYIINLDPDELMEYLAELNFEVKKEDADEFAKLITGMLPMFVFLQTTGLISATLGTSKLETIFSEEISNNKNPVAKRFVYTLLYSDLKLPAYLDKFEKILKEILDNDLYCEIAKFKLTYIYDFVKLTPSQKNQVENMIAGIIVRKSDHSNLRKAGVIADLRSQRIKGSNIN